LKNSVQQTLPDEPFGMIVESVLNHDGQTIVETTGAIYVIDSGRGRVHIEQKIGKRRRLATLHGKVESFAGATSDAVALATLQVEHHSPGSVVLRTPDGRTRMQINGDSLFSLSSDAETWMTLRIEFNPEFQSHANGHSMYMDSLGGITVHPLRDHNRPAAFPPRPQGVCSTENGRMVDILRVEPGEELWLSVAPTRAFEWMKSFTSIYWHRGSGTEFWTQGNSPLPWTPDTAWPDDEAYLNRIAEEFDILHLQAECALWQNWTHGYTPRFPEKARRCLNIAHAAGLKVVVYASPFYFLSGTPFETLKLNDPEWPREWWRCGNYHGDNWEKYTEAVAKLISEYCVDGIYFDSSFLLSLANSYKMTRRIRHILGKDRILYDHCTYAPPAYSNRISCPALNTYSDFILRGEENAELFTDSSHVRYCISDYCMGNAVSLLCNSGNHATVTREWVDQLLAANARLPLDPRTPADVWQYYQQRVTELEGSHAET
jgi:hypothetical protein